MLMAVIGSVTVPVRSPFSYHHDSAAISLFLLFDYAGPHQFDPTMSRVVSGSTRIADLKP